MKKNFNFGCCFVSMMLALLLTQPAYAYLDAGSGSMMLQLLLGGFAGLALIAKLYWEKIRSVFGGKKREDKDGMPQESKETDLTARGDK